MEPRYLQEIQARAGINPPSPCILVISFTARQRRLASLPHASRPPSGCSQANLCWMRGAHYALYCKGKMPYDSTVRAPGNGAQPASCLSLLRGQIWTACRSRLQLLCWG